MAPPGEEQGREGASRRLKIIAGSTLISDIASDLLDGGADILTLAPPEASPTGDDLKAASTAFAAEADLAVLHGFQANEALFRELVSVSGNRSLTMTVVQAAGSWQIPASQKLASEETARILSAAAPELSGLITVRLARRLKSLEAVELEARALAGSLAGVPVAASEMQAWFLNWAGIFVAWSFGGSSSPGGFPPSQPPPGLEVELVADDLQTGGGAGEAVARRFGAPLAVLSSFPGAPEDSPDYLSLVRGNFRRLEAAWKASPARPPRRR
ncbi:MAG: hypothetical protein LBW85_00025 [Deltaproteobacteria bacterium]|jgi:zinc transport system substrate-binding protein|nr:hypothetical protein [Deltaproteobacteria bacterium]